MPEPPSAFVGLEDLVDLAPGGEIDMRPTLLRVLTDLYVQRPTHTPEDERYYVELASRLVDAADAAERARLAQRLASYPGAPRALLQRLARDTIDVAAPILRHSPCLDDRDLAAVADDLGGAHAEIIAARRCGMLPPAQIPSDAPSFAAIAAAELAELFYAAGAAERRLILLGLDYASIPPRAPSALMQRSDVWRLEAAALRHNTHVVVSELERVLSISRAQARRILADDSGEPITAAAKAMDLPGDVLQRMLLFINPRVGQSVDRVYELTHLYGEISVAGARRLVAILQDADADQASPVRHQPVPWRTAAENARRALSELSRGPAHWRERRVRGTRGS